MGAWILILPLFVENIWYLNMYSPCKIKTLSTSLFIHYSHTAPVDTIHIPDQGKSWKDRELELSIPRARWECKQLQECSKYCICAYPTLHSTSLYLSYQFQYFVRFLPCPSCGTETCFISHVRRMGTCALLTYHERFADTWPQVSSAAHQGVHRDEYVNNAVSAFSIFVNRGLNL